MVAGMHEEDEAMNIKNSSEKLMIRPNITQKYNQYKGGFSKAKLEPPVSEEEQSLLSLISASFVAVRCRKRLDGIWVCPDREPFMAWLERGKEEELLKPLQHKRKRV